MATPREKALNTVKYLKIAPSSIDQLATNKTLHVTGAPSCWPATVVAQYCLRVALEQGCTKIRVYIGQHKKRDYDVMDLVTLSRKWHAGGHLGTPKGLIVPKYLATEGMKALGSFTDTKETLVTVPSSPLVSSDPGQEGATNGK